MIKLPTPSNINSQLKKAVMLLVLTTAFLFGAKAINAQEQQSLIAIPDRIGAEGTLRAEPGEVVQTNVRFRNGSKQTLKIVTKAQDFIIKEDGKTPIPVDETVSNRWSLASWMVITPNLHTVAPGQTVEMQVLIEVPEDATPGGHYAIVVHEPTNASLDTINDQPLSASAVSQRVGTLIYFVVEGDINEEAYVRNFRFKRFQEFGPVPFAYKISNQSDIHIRPRMSIDVFNMLGKKVDSILIDSKNIFPFNSRDFAGKWEKIYGFGLYKAKLTMSYGEAGKVAVADSSFWIIPVRIILAVLIILLTIGAVYAAIRRHIKHKVEQEENKVQDLQKQIEDLKRPKETSTPESEE